MLVSWDDDIPSIWKSKNHVPNHQPAFINPGVKPQTGKRLKIDVENPLCFTSSEKYLLSLS